MSGLLGEDVATTNFERQITHTNSEDDSSIPIDKIANIYVVAHGGEIFDEKLNFTNLHIKPSNVRIFSYVGSPGICNAYKLPQEENDVANTFSQIHSEMNAPTSNNGKPKSTYKTIRTILQSRRDNMEKIAGEIDGNPDSDLTLYKKHVERGENIRTYNPIINKLYTPIIIADSFFQGGIFYLAKDGKYENMMSVANVFEYLIDFPENSTSKTSNIFIERLLNSIKTQGFDKNALITDSLDKTKLVFEKKDEKYIITKKDDDKFKIDVNIVRIKRNNMMLNELYLSDIITIFTELGALLINIIDSSCRVVSKTRLDTEYMSHDDPKILALGRQEYDETNINETLGGFRNTTRKYKKTRKTRKTREKRQHRKNKKSNKTRKKRQHRNKQTHTN